jgi:hypothetical protein
VAEVFNPERVPKRLRVRDFGTPQLKKLCHHNSFHQNLYAPGMAPGAQAPATKKTLGGMHAMVAESAVAGKM